MFTQTFRIVSILTPFNRLSQKTWRCRFLPFHGVIEANVLVRYAIIFTAALSSCEGLICRAHCNLYRSGKDEQGKGWLHYIQYLVSDKHTFPAPSESNLCWCLLLMPFLPHFSSQLTHWIFLSFQIWWRILMKHPRMRLTRGNWTPGVSKLDRTMWGTMCFNV